MDPKKPEPFNLRAIFSKTGKGVQEASGKTSHLSRADRAVLSAIDGKTMLSDVSAKFEKLSADKFDALMHLLDKDGFIREVSSGQAAAPTVRPTVPAAKAPPKAPPPADDGDEMDFTQAVKIPAKGPAPSAPKAPPVDLAAMGRADAERKAKDQQSTDYKAREEAEAKAKAEAEAKARAAAEARAQAEARARAEADAKTRAEADAKVKSAREAAVRMATEAKAKSDAAERDKARLEAELNAKLEAERKAREEAEKRAAEASDRARKELEAEMKAKFEAESKAREEEDRKRRAEDDRRRKEEDERRAKEDAERRAREEADRKKREEEDRKRREEDERRRKDEDERRAREDAERKKREEDDRKRRKEEDERRAKDEAERRALEDTNRKLETDRRAREEAERKAKDDAERRARQEAEAKARAAADAAASLPKVEAVAPPPPPPAAAPAGGVFGDSLLADLDSFGKREEEEQKEKEEAERNAKEQAARKAKEEAERRAKEEAQRKAKEEAERKAKEEEARRAKEDEERRAKEEEEQRKEEEAERKRKAKEALAAKQAEERTAKAAASKGAGKAADDDIDVSEDDLDKDDLKRDQKVASDRARKVAREAAPAVVVATTGGRRMKWGKPAAIALFVLLIVGVAALNLMPLSTAEYEKAASDALGVPVKIGSARLQALAGIEVKLENVTVGGAKIRLVRGSPEVGSLFGARKSFSRIELEGLQLSQSQLGDALTGKAAGENFRVGRIVVKQLALEGPLKLPPLDVEATVGGDGTLQTVKLTGADKLVVTLVPKGGEIGFDVSAGSFAMPFVPALSLSEFAMKGTANRSGVVSSEFDGRAFDGVISGTSRIRWGDSWTVEGELNARTLKVAVFAPTLVSEGRVGGRATYSMSGSTPGTLYEVARMQGEFKIENGVLGSFDVSRALQTGGAQSGGRTVFNELTGQGLYDKGAMQFTGISFSAGALNAGASLNIDAQGTLSGRLVADVKTASQKQSATLNISGKVQDPVIRK